MRVNITVHSLIFITCLLWALYLIVCHLYFWRLCLAKRSSTLWNKLRKKGGTRFEEKYLVLLSGVSSVRVSYACTLSYDIGTNVML